MPRPAKPGSKPPAAAETDPHAAKALSAWVARDARSLTLVEQVRRVAASRSTVLIRGESGTGKDLLAVVIHYLGEGRQQPLVKIDCAALPLELLESELFGHERGAFTGATQQKPGRLELAGAGTLVLDEVAALTLPMQAKVLRAIEEKRFERLGGSRTVTLAARILALTSVELERAVARGSFREDLFYRLNVVPLSIPPLRERRADIRPLAERLLAQLGAAHNRGPLRLDPGALALLERYDFPGNVRELRNLLERAAVYGSSLEITAQDLPEQVRSAAPAGGAGKKRTLAELEREYIAEVLDLARGRKSRAAEILGISRKTLLEKRKKYGLD